MELVLPAPKAETESESGHNGPAVVAVLSGKGGVGKTIISTNMAAALASEQTGVLLIDCDVSAGQSHLILGLCPQGGLAQVVRGEKKLKQILLGAGEGLFLAPGGPSGGAALELEGKKVRKLLSEARQAAPTAKAIVLDAGPGHRGALGDFIDAADIAMVVCTPEPTAIRATVAMLEVMLTERPGASPYLVVNMAASERDALDAYEKIKDALLPVFMGDLRLLGWLPYDLEVTRSLWRYRPIVRDVARTRAGRGLRDLTGALAGLIGGSWRISTGTAVEGPEDLPSVDFEDGGQARAA